MPREPDRPQDHEPPPRGVPPTDQAPDPVRVGGLSETKSFKDKAALAADRTPSPTPETDAETSKTGGMIGEGSTDGSTNRQRQGGMIGDA